MVAFGKISIKNKDMTYLIAGINSGQKQVFRRTQCRTVYLQENPDCSHLTVLPGQSDKS